MFEERPARLQWLVLGGVSSQSCAQSRVHREVACGFFHICTLAGVEAIHRKKSRSHGSSGPWRRRLQAGEWGFPRTPESGVSSSRAHLYLSVARAGCEPQRCSDALPEVLPEKFVLHLVTALTASDIRVT